MTNVALITRWKATEVVLERARAALPPPAVAVREQFEALVARFHEYIAHNELGLAFDELCAAAELVNCRGGVWRDLGRAAELMELYDRVPDLHKRFLAAPVGESSVNTIPRRGDGNG